MEDDYDPNALLEIKQSLIFNDSLSVDCKTNAQTQIKDIVIMPSSKESK